MKEGLEHSMRLYSYIMVTTLVLDSPACFQTISLFNQNEKKLFMSFCKSVTTPKNVPQPEKYLHRPVDLRLVRSNNAQRNHV